MQSTHSTNDVSIRSQENRCRAESAMGEVAASAKGRMTLAWSSSLNSWQDLKLELQLEAEKIFASSGEVVIVSPAASQDRY